jgi:hypothetical protein
MELLRLLLRYLHLVGFALLFGGVVVQYIAGRYTISIPMRVGLGTALGTGLLLAIPFPEGIELDYTKLGVKLFVGMLIGAAFGIAVTRDRAGKAVHRAHLLAIGGLVLLNAAVAVFWR